MPAVQVVEPQMHDEFTLVWIPRFTRTQLLASVEAVVVFGFKRKIVITADATNDRFNGFICNGNGLEPEWVVFGLRMGSGSGSGEVKGEFLYKRPLFSLPVTRSRRGPRSQEGAKQVSLN